MSDVREKLGKIVRDAWVAAVLELVPDPKPSWIEPWETLEDPFQREVDMRIGEAVAAVEHAKSSNPEFFCQRCNVIHPQPGRFPVHSCPGCGLSMVPTSPSRRRIDELEAQNKILRDLAADMRSRFTNCDAVAEAYVARRQVRQWDALLEEATP